MSKLTKINISNFTKFKNISIDFSKGINVFIGENGTGKTHLLKIMYSFLKTSEKHSNFGQDLLNKLDNVFVAKGVKNLISKNQEAEASVSLLIDDNDYNFSIFQNDDFAVGDDEMKFENISHKTNIDQLENIQTLFIPTHEIITTYVELRDWLERFKSNFEEIYLDLAKAMFQTRTKKIGSLKNIHEQINNIIDGNVIVENNEFFVEYKNMKIRATMLAEGVKKFILFDQLIQNQSLTENTILFLDEPEVHFNPKFITKLTKLLIDIANKGVQVFIATHDYLFIHQLSLMSEYRATIEQSGDKIPQIKFHSLCRNNDFTKIETTKKLSELTNNSILDEFTELYNNEQKLFTEATK